MASLLAMVNSWSSKTRSSPSRLARVLDPRQRNALLEADDEEQGAQVRDFTGARHVHNDVARGRQGSCALVVPQRPRRLIRPEVRGRTVRASPRRFVGTTHRCGVAVCGVEALEQLAQVARYGD